MAGPKHAPREHEVAGSSANDALGQCRATFLSAKPRKVLMWVLAVMLLGAAYPCFRFAAGALRAERAPAIVGGAVLVALGIVCATCGMRKQKPKVFVHENGLVVRGWNRSRVMLWENVREFYRQDSMILDSLGPAELAGLLINTRASYRIVPRQGRSVSFSDRSVDRVRELAAKVEEALTRTLLPRLMRTLENQEDIDFGLIQAHPTGLTIPGWISRKTVPWEALTWGVDKRHLTVGAVGQRLPFKCELGEIPNLFVLQRILEKSAKQAH